MVRRSRGHHKTVLVKWDGYEARVDEGIAPLIKEIWKAGIFTLLSCEENRPGIMWIEFASAIEAKAFLNIVARYEEDINSLYNRIRQGWSRIDGVIPGAWEYAINPFDYSMEQRILDDDSIEESCSGPSEFIFSMGIRFLKADYPILLDRMREFIANCSQMADTGAA
jgi:hypothetical protein